MNEWMDDYVKKNSMEDFLHFEYLTAIGMTLSDLLHAEATCPFIGRKTLEYKYLPVTKQQQTQHLDS